MHATAVPATWVGGDFYDAICLDADRVVLLLGDVSGKGIPAAMQMARHRLAQQTQRAIGEDVMEIICGAIA